MRSRIALITILLLLVPAAATDWKAPEMPWKAPGMRGEVSGTGAQEDGRTGEVVFDRSSPEVFAFDGSPDVSSAASANPRQPRTTPPPARATEPTVPTGLTGPAGDAKDLSRSAKPRGDHVHSYPTPEGPAPPPTRPAVTFVRVNQSNGGMGFTASAQRDEVVVLQGFWRQAESHELRFANPTTKIFIYQNVSRAVPTVNGTYSSLVSLEEAQASGWDSGVLDQDAAGGHILSPTYANGTSTATDYARYACEEFKRKAAESALAGYRVDGVFLDDDNTSRDGVGGAAVWDPWMETVNSILGPCVKAAGYYAMPNLAGAAAGSNLMSGGWVARQFQYFDYSYSEYSAWFPGGAAQAQANINELFRLAGVANTARNVFVLGEYQGAPESQQIFTLGICLIQTQGYCGKGTGVGNTDEWYPAYDRARQLGQPTAPATSPSSGVWSRQFQGGTVRVDLNERTATIG